MFIGVERIEAIGKLKVELSYNISNKKHLQPMIG
jgi:hypothetical protein